MERFLTWVLIAATALLVFWFLVPVLGEIALDAAEQVGSVLP